jgi:hypothetical protein
MVDGQHVGRPATTNLNAMTPVTSHHSEAVPPDRHLNGTIFAAKYE